MDIKVYNTQYCKHWTTTAIDCYNRKLKCEGCNVYLLIGEDCKMKQSVLELVRKFGKPPKEEDKYLTYSDIEQTVIELIKYGKDRYYIADNIGVNYGTMSGILRRVYTKAKKEGFESKTQRFMFEEYKEWLDEL